MNNFMYTDPELQVLTERCRKYQGTAKININQITSHPSVSRHISEKNVGRLCEIFDKEGCRRLDVHNHVSAVVSIQHLHEALQAAGINTADLLTDQPSRFPHLHFSAGAIKCLHGQHRLKAGELFLPSIDQWWTVDLYLDDISPNLQTSLVDEYSNERVPSDGEIYVKVRQYRNQANAHFENRWLARLSDNKTRRLRGLESHPSVRAAFDSLLALPSLLIHGMQIGSLPHALAICCDEEMVHALNQLLQFWSTLVGHDRAKMLRIDTHTVDTLQLLAPGVSSKDRTTVKGIVHSGEVFSNFTDSERSSIWKRLKKTDRIIPSLYTFFKDLWYLESCANCMKRLITPSRSFPTIRGAIRAAYSTHNPTHEQFLIQTSETGFRYYSHSQGDPAELGYRQLWLYAMRHYPNLSKVPQKKDPTAKANREAVEPMVLYDMAILAKRLGFQSPQIEQLIQQSPDRKIAQEALLRARRPDRYRYNEREVETLINKVTECFLRAIPLDHPLPGHSVGGRETKKESRCGHPQIQAQLQDCPFLFIDQLHGDSFQRERKATSTLVRRSVYFTFFSQLSMPSVNGNLTGVSPNPDVPMSPLFVPSDRSPQDEGIDDIEAESSGAEQESSLERQRVKIARREQRRQKRVEKRAKKLRRRQQREQRKHQSSRASRYSTSSSRNFPESENGHFDSEESGINETLEPIAETESGTFGNREIIGENEESENHAELAFEGEQPQGRSEESIWEDASLEENTSEQDDEATETAAQHSPAAEVQRALNILEGHGPSNIISGPSRVLGRKSTALREKAKFKPYDQTQRRQRTRKPAISPQETLEQDINALLHPAAREQRHITQINFLEAQHRSPSATNEEQSSRPIASPTGQTQDGQQMLEETVGSVEFDPQPELPSSTDQHPSLSSPPPPPPEEFSTQTDTRSQKEKAGAERPFEEEDKSSGRGEGANDTTTRSAVTITFRARDENGEWNRLVHEVVVDPSDSSPVERMAAKQARAHQATYYDRNLRQVPPGQCFDAAIEDGTNTIFMTFGDDMAVSEETVDSITRALQVGDGDDQPSKRKQRT
ncbi:uncharacterized protein N7484_008140 [Penicillium longicatenatum]|uniref:uncharacterized protein n=1 Tax=Penicillium longicatenatum TaxID=1561947 RepID=UPI002549250A|nr:uncharacterized protein N7484_008140 [Penicillium longicatenatum]KAJ5640278.1 hypothetical protein N7484_008140 [Penicillium longicatenatum]